MKGSNMDWLKEVLGDELFAKFTERLNAYNGDENNKEKQIGKIHITVFICRRHDCVSRR